MIELSTKVYYLEIKEECERAFEKFLESIMLDETYYTKIKRIGKIEYRLMLVGFESSLIKHYLEVFDYMEIKGGNE